MEIREALESDIPEIVNLLKLSLGESLMPKSERYWRWKHLENPFGASPVLLCHEGKELIGVRAFMRWEWIYQGRVYRALRAVDTATHPQHQGKGIFKKLTLSLVDRCKQRGDHFVFNTPNQQSKPGYLKMGWEEVARLPVRASIHRPFRMMKNFITNSSLSGGEYETADPKYYLGHTSLSVLVKDHHQQMKQLVTNVSVPYLAWRYQEVPVVRYVAFGEEQKGQLTGLIIGRIKETRFGRQLRITDQMLTRDSDGRELIRNLKESIKKWGIDYTTFAGNEPSFWKRWEFSGVHAKASVGPIVTIRSLTLSDLQMLKNFNKWSPSLGDLELF